MMQSRRWRVERARTTPLPVVDGDAAARATPETARYSRTLGGSIWLIVLKQRRLVECGTASQRSCPRAVPGGTDARAWAS
jgi:hypothetical protein